jgi:hypothetical protein
MQLDLFSSRCRGVADRSGPSVQWWRNAVCACVRRQESQWQRSSADLPGTLSSPETVQPYCLVAVLELRHLASPEVNQETDGSKAAAEPGGSVKSERFCNRRNFPSS